MLGAALNTSGARSHHRQGGVRVVRWALPFVGAIDKASLSAGRCTSLVALQLVYGWHAGLGRLSSPWRLLQWTSGIVANKNYVTSQRYCSTTAARRKPSKTTSKSK